MPVYPGAGKPFCRGAVHAADIHGVCLCVYICCRLNGSGTGHAEHCLSRRIRSRWHDSATSTFDRGGPETERCAGYAARFDRAAEGDGVVGGYGGADECGVVVRYVSGAGGACEGVEYYGWGYWRRFYGCTDGVCGG